jgi:hypothetical protein
VRGPFPTGRVINKLVSGEPGAVHLVIGSIAALVCYCVGSGVGISFDQSHLPSSISLDLPNLLLKEVSAWNQKAFTPNSPPS